MLIASELTRAILLLPTNKAPLAVDFAEETSEPIGV